MLYDFFIGCALGILGLVVIVGISYGACAASYWVKSIIPRK